MSSAVDTEHDLDDEWPLHTRRGGLRMRVPIIFRLD